MPDFQLLCGGFPCQTFSIAGSRKGFGDPRGTLFFELARLAEARKPPYLLFENVVGLINHDHCRTFATILNTLDRLGYGVEWQCLNSKDFGVPQSRNRVYIVGYLDDILAKNNPADRIRLDELVELMLDTVCSKRSSIRIAGDEFPTEVVKSRFLKLEAQHIQYVLDSLKDNPPHIRNIKKYLLAALYNAPLTIENYYAAQINHDLYGRNRGDVNWK